MYSNTVLLSVEGALMVNVGVATLICVSAKSVNECFNTIIVHLCAYLSRFRAERKRQPLQY